MNKLTRSLVALVLPAATAKATPVRGKCIAGCGEWGIYDIARAADGKRPCCS